MMNEKRFCKGIVDNGLKESAKIFANYNEKIMYRNKHSKDIEDNRIKGDRGTFTGRFEIMNRRIYIR